MSTHTATRRHATRDDGARVVSVSEEMDEAVRIFLAERTRLLRVAYRVVGDSAAAEDVVQEAWMRWQRVDRRQIKNPAAFLTTATTHLAINLIQSARHRHELPSEMLRASLGAAQDPTDHAESEVTVDRTMGFLMAKLSAAELCAFLLRKCFDYPYQEVADVLGTSPANARQLVRRSHLSMVSSRARRVDLDAHRRLVSAFLMANESGDLLPLVGLLADGARRAVPCRATQKRRASGVQCGTHSVSAGRPPRAA